MASNEMKAIMAEHIAEEYRKGEAADHNLIRGNLRLLTLWESIAIQRELRNEARLAKWQENHGDSES